MTAGYPVVDPAGGCDARTGMLVVTGRWRHRDGTSLRLLYPELGDALEIAWASAPLPGAGCSAG